MLTSNVTIRATNFVMYALVARYLGTLQFGQLALAVSLFYSTHMFAMAGLKTLITREVAKDKNLTGQYLINASVVVILTSIMSILFMAVFLRVMEYSSDTSSVIMLLFIGLIPFTLSQICEGIFQAWERMSFIAYANVPLSILQTAAAFVLLFLGYEVPYVVLTIIVSYVAILLVEWIFLLRHIIKPQIKVDGVFSKHMLKASFPFLGIQGTNAIKSSIHIVLLSRLLGEVEVGLYSAAHQLLVPLEIIFNNVVGSLFPVMARKFKSGAANLQRITEHLIEFLFVIALPAVIGLLLVAEPVLLLLYEENDFLQSAQVLRILVWLPLGQALTAVLGQVLWASQNEKLALRISIVNTIVKGVVGFILIQEIRLIGAAIATALVVFINVIQHYLPAARLLSGIQVGKLVWKPLLASAAMGGFILAAGRLPILALIAAAAVFYAIILSALFIWSNGGLYQFKAKYQHLWVKSWESGTS